MDRNPIKCRALLACKEIIKGPGGTPSLISLFSVATSNRLPFRATFFVYAETTGGEGAGKLTLRILDPAGAMFYEIGVNVDFDEPGEDGHSRIRLEGFEFSECGVYVFQLRAGDKVLMEKPITVALTGE